ncbi:MAG: aminotransferase class V-fold PLP-dependent enzyme [Thermomicrobiales bacterium]|nr:aminotransferase class V-fold PLP-dependent enzyme [Thermomicrobiales bacterium]
MSIVATERDLARLRADLPAVGTTGYFNAGTNGPLPRAAQEALVTAATTELEIGRIVPGVYERNHRRNRDVAATIGGMFGANPDEIALTHSTGEGLNAALMGLSWEPGDEVVTTNLEHPGLFLPLALLAHRSGVRTRVADIKNGEGDVVAALEAQLTAATRVIAISHLMWSSGAVMPLRQIADLARECEALVIVDAAQAAGQIPVDLHALGVDAYAAPGQKWLCGPEATGFLYVRRDRFADIAPTYIRYGSFDPSGYLIPNPTAARYEIGEFYGPAVEAHHATLRWLRDVVGLDWAYSRIAELGQRFRAGIAALPDVTVLTPADRMAGLINFTTPAMRPQELTAKLYERGQTIRYVDTRPCPVSVRVSTGWWNTEEEVDRLVADIADVLVGANDETAG